MAIRFGLLPQVLPLMLAQALYFLREQHALRRHPRRRRGGRDRLQIAERIKVRHWDEVAVHHHPHGHHRRGDRLDQRQAAPAG
jgi:phosphonate transport system permease protein